MPSAGPANAALRAPARAHTVILVEGPSDREAVEQLAIRLGHDLPRRGVATIAIGGATNFERYARELGPSGANLTLTGLCDAPQERALWRGLSYLGLADPTRERAEQLGFFTCEADLEDELIRAIGVPATLAIIDAAGRGKKFRRYQRQPDQRDRNQAQHLRGYVTNWKIDFARRVAQTIPLDQIPRPLLGVLHAATAA